MKLTKQKLYLVVIAASLIVIAFGAFFIVQANKKKNTSNTDAQIKNVEETTSQAETIQVDQTETSESGSVTENGTITESSDSSANTGNTNTSDINTEIMNDTDVESGSTETDSQSFTPEYNNQNYYSGSTNSGSGNSNSQNSGSGNSGSQTPVTPPSSGTPSVDTSLSVRQQVLELTNQIRNEVGASNLVLDDQLSAIADIRAKEIVTSFEHTRPNGTSFYTAMDENGYSYTTCGENIAYGYSTPSAVVTAWKNSSGHYKNMVTTGFGRLGVGVYVSNGTYYWVQLFSN